VPIREIATPAAGDENLSARLPIVFEQRHPPPALPSHGRAHQPCRPGAKNNYIELARVSGHTFSSE
jgi:hypothetical protein